MNLLEPVDEVERLAVEQRELLLDGDREVLASSKRSRASVRSRSCGMQGCMSPKARRFRFPFDRDAEPACNTLSHGRVEQARGDAGPAPPLLHDPADGRPERRPLVGAEPEQRREPFVERGRVRGREGDEPAELGGSASSRPAATSARPEWRATTGGQPAAAASAATIPNASGKIDGTTQASASASRWRR